MREEEVVKYFDKLRNANELSHAYLIECDSDIVLNEVIKNTLATFFCEKNNLCKECNSCLKTLNKENMNIVWVGDGVTSIKKNDIKTLIDYLNKSNIQQDQRKIYVINNAENMTTESANSILKTLEEPPKNVLSFVLTKDKNEVLSTIKSRCNLIHIESEDSFNEENILIDALTKRDKNILFKISAEIRKSKKDKVLKVLLDTLNNYVIKSDLGLILDFTTAIDKIKRVNNFSLIIEELFIKIYEVI